MIKNGKPKSLATIILMTLLASVLAFFTVRVSLDHDRDIIVINTIQHVANNMEFRELKELAEAMAAEEADSDRAANILRKMGYYSEIDNGNNITPLIASGCCVIFGLLACYFVYDNNKKYNTLFLELSTWAEDIANGKFTGGYEVYGEGAFAVFVKQFNIMERSTEGMVNSLQKEKEHIREFIANISHQLKTPLATLSLYQEMIYEDNFNNEIGEKSKICLNQINRMEWLVNTLLKIAKFDASTIKLNYQKNILLQTIKHGVEMAFSENGDKDVELSYQGDLTSKVYHDPYWLAEAIENIVKNAIKWVPHDGEIVITIEKGEALVIISIEDNGGGFAEQDIPHLFDRFYTTRKNRSSKLKGVGIGLALVKAIVDTHNGNIKAYNGVRGAVFKISIPILEN